MTLAIFNEPLQTTEEELYVRAKRDRTVRAKLALAHAPLVKHIARQYLSRGVEYDDLVQEGMIGLIHAIDLFDPTLGYQFSTYASYWVRYAMQRAIWRAAPVRIPREKRDRVLQARDQLTQELGRDPTVEEIAARSGIESSDVLAVLQAAEPPVSLNRRAREEEEALEYGELLVGGESAEAEVLGRLPSERLLAAFEKLTPRQREVLFMYHGVAGRRMTMAEIGRRLGISQQAVQQSLARAHRILRVELRRGADGP